MYLLASAVRFSGDYQRAIALHEESLALKREQGDAWSIGASLFSLGSLARMLGDTDRAAMLYSESLEVRWRLRDQIGMCVCMEGLAALEADATLATRLLASAQRLREQVGANQRAHRPTEQLVAQLRMALGGEVFTETWQSGRDLPAGLIIEQALASPAHRPDAVPAARMFDNQPEATMTDVGREPPVPVPQQQFRDLVEDALRHLNDAPALREHQLLGLMASATGSRLHPAEAATQLRSDLLAAIDRLRPEPPRPSPRSYSGAGGWLHYLVLYESYVEERENKQVMLRYEVSEGTFYRARKRAIDAIAQDLSQRGTQPTRP
jgi:hypothetical protein